MDAYVSKWYYKTWFIGILYALCIITIGISLIPAIILTVKQNNYLKLAESISNEYGGVVGIVNKTKSLQQEYDAKDSALQSEYDKKMEDLESKYAGKESELKSVQIQTLKELNERVEGKRAELKELKEQTAILDNEVECKAYSFAEYDALTSEECKNKLSLLKQSEKDLIDSGTNVTLHDHNAPQNIIKAKTRRIMRCFNAECDNVLLNLTVKKIDPSRKKITSSYDAINKMFDADGIQLSKKLLEAKLEELNLVYTFELKHQQEVEFQKEAKAQMLEEEKALRELEQEKKKIEKDQSQMNQELKRLMGYLQKTDADVEKQLYADKIKELEGKLKELEEHKKDVEHRAATATAGYVYVISNIGSFGDDIYKIGMTRRLEPMDRVKELSSASVPFEFDVHAMIFSENAPELETTLHNTFREQSVNKINYRKEFFNVSIDEIEKVVKEKFDETVEFTKIPVATEYRQSLELVNQ